MNNSWYYRTFLNCGTSWYYGTLALLIYLYNYTRSRLQPCLPNNAVRRKYLFRCKDVKLTTSVHLIKKKRPSCLSHQKSQMQKHSGNWPDMHELKNPCCTKVFCVNTRYSTEKKWHSGRSNTNIWTSALCLFTSLVTFCMRHRISARSNILEPTAKPEVNKEQSPKPPNPAGKQQEAQLRR